MTSRLLSSLDPGLRRDDVALPRNVTWIPDQVRDDVALPRDVTSIG
jgi:hypothetical protein